MKVTAFVKVVSERTVEIEVPDSVSLDAIKDHVRQRVYESPLPGESVRMVSVLNVVAQHGLFGEVKHV